MLLLKFVELIFCMLPFCIPVNWEAISPAKSEDRGKGIRDLRSHGFVKQLSVRAGPVNQFQKLELLQTVISSHNAMKLKFNNKNKKFLLLEY